MIMELENNKIKECTRCNQFKIMVKSRWCRDCCRTYENNRRNTPENKIKINTKSKEKYTQKRNQLLNNPVQFDLTQTKQCTVCEQVKTLDNFHQAICKGTIRLMCKICACVKRKEYYKTNKEKVNKQIVQYQNKKIKSDPEFKLLKRTRTRIGDAFKSQNLKKNGRTIKYLDCTSLFFKDWIEFQLYGKMTLNNYGKI